jgi:hypothetical protein
LDAGGLCAAAVYSLIETAKANGLGPEACLRHVIHRIVDHSVNRVRQLLLWDIAGIRLRLHPRLAHNPTATRRAVAYAAADGISVELATVVTIQI